MMANEDRIVFWVDGMFWNVLESEQWLYNYVNILKPTKMYTLNDKLYGV